MKSVLATACLILVVALPGPPSVEQSPLRAETATGAPLRVADRKASSHSVELAAGLIPGVVKPSACVIVSAPINGLLQELLIQEGQHVRRGELLGVIDNRVATAAAEVAKAVASARARLDHAKHELALAAQMLEREKLLFSRQAGTQHALEEATARFEKAKAEAAAVIETQTQANCQWKLEQARLEAHNIRAPFDGQIIQIAARPGATLSDGDELLTIVNMKSLDVELHLPVQLYGALKRGQSYGLVAEEPINARLSGTLKYTAPVIDSATLTFRSMFTIANTDLELPAGFAAKLDVESLAGNHPPLLGRAGQSPGHASPRSR